MKFKLTVNKNNTFKAMGWLIKYVRVSQGYSLRDLGALTNISHTFIANIEKGVVVSSKQTIEDILKVLNVDYHFEDEIIDDFVPQYDKIFNWLYYFEYDKAEIAFNELEKKADIYNSSTVVPDYYLLKFFYLALHKDICGDEEVRFLNMLSITQYLSDYQNQLLHLIEGIYNFNKGNNCIAKEKLEKALTLGNKDLDLLTNTYLVKCNVSMYEFMESQKIGKKAIVLYENDLNYSRAMEIRLSFARSYFLVRKFSETKHILKKVYNFATHYSTPILLERCYLIQGAVAIVEKDYVTAERLLEKVNIRDPRTQFTKILLALRTERYETAQEIYDEFLKDNEIRKSKVNGIALKLTMNKYEMLDLTEDEYLDNVTQLIKYGEQACDMESLNSGYGFIINYYKEKRMYKKALEMSEKARLCRSYGCENQKK